MARRGYRFLADITVVDADPQPEAARGVLFGLKVCIRYINNAIGCSRHTPGSFGLGLLLVLALTASVSWNLYSRHQSSHAIRSLAVLPLENLSMCFMDYFADGMTEELITTLGQISALRVISHVGDDLQRSPQAAGADCRAELNVEAVVRGGVFRSGDRGSDHRTKLIPGPGRQAHMGSKLRRGPRDTLTLKTG